MNKNNDMRHTIPKEQLRNKSSWLDAILGRVRTDEWDNDYENLPTKLSSRFYNNGKFYGLLKKLYKIYCDIVGPFHILPDFLILGPTDCGITSMLELYLRSNENILPSKHNEIHYFDRKHTNSINWYKVLFPSIFTKKFRSIIGKKTLTCEASGSYILDPHASKRIEKIIPDVKFVVMLRNPADRTLSHYKRRFRLRIEKRSFEEAIEYEQNNFKKEFQEYQKDENAIALYPPTSYLARSRYVEYIENWLGYFPKERFLFINSNDYFKDPLKEYNRILEFIGLASHHPNIKGKRGISPPGLFDNIVIKPETIEFLRNYFQPWNEKLFNLIGVKYDWK